MTQSRALHFLKLGWVCWVVFLVGRVFLRFEVSSSVIIVQGILQESGWHHLALVPCQRVFCNYIVTSSDMLGDFKGTAPLDIKWLDKSNRRNIPKGQIHFMRYWTPVTTVIYTWITTLGNPSSSCIHVWRAELSHKSQWISWGNIYWPSHLKTNFCNTVGISIRLASLQGIAVNSSTSKLLRIIFSSLENKRFFKLGL